MTARQPTAPAKTCPNCNSTLAPAAVLCVQCGYHLEKGQVLAAPPEAAEAAEAAGAAGRNFAWIAFPVGAAASLGLLAWFGSSEFTTPGMSWSVGLLVMNLIVLAIGTYYAVQENSIGVSGEERMPGWIAAIVAALGCGFVALFFGRWLPIFGVWLGLHILLLVALYVSRRE